MAFPSASEVPTTSPSHGSTSGGHMESLEASLAPAVACIRYEKSYTVTGDVYVCVVVPRNGLSASGMSERVLYTVVCSNPCRCNAGITPPHIEASRMAGPEPP